MTDPKTATVLMIVTSADRMGDGGRPTGLWAEELAAPWYALADAGIKIALASPKGGPAPIDPGSLQPKGENAPVVDRFLDDASAQARVKSTVKLDTLEPANFDAVFFPGGHGAMWDLPTDPAVIAAVEAAWAAGKPIATVCHGAAALVGAKLPNGRPLVDGLRVNSFTDAEERAVGLDRTVPFLLESRLREQGARFEHTDNWQSFAIRDGRLITGQNPQSSAEVAKLLIEAVKEG